QGSAACFGVGQAERWSVALFVVRRTLRGTLQAASWLAARRDSMKDSGIQGHMTDKQCSLLSAIVVY
ncbi:hypothetical protein C9F07_29735, partial [Salmonella enterica subsp. enterica serovar Poona]